MRSASWKLCTVATLLLAASHATAQSAPLRVSLADTIRTALPGTAVSYVFTMQLPEAEGASVATLSLPPQWRALTGGDGQLPSGSRHITYMVAAAVPLATPPGRYRIELAVTQSGNTSRASGWVIVPAVRSLKLSALDAPGMVVAGSRITGRFLLSNLGNARTSVRVRIRTQPFAILDSMLVELAPGASREIPVKLETDARTRALTQSITSVTAEESGLSGEVARASFRVSIAPRDSYAAAPIHTIGSRIRLIGASTQRGGSGLEITGSGLLNDGSATRVEYVARRMMNGQSLFGDRDEYRVDVESPVVRLSIGDQLHTLSALSENGRYARGARAEVGSKGWILGGFVNRESTLLSKTEQRAAFLSRDVGKGLTLDVNFLDRREPNGGSMLTARSNIRSLPIGTVEAEAGRALNSSATAWMIGARGYFKRFSYGILRQKSGRDYPGSTRGTQSVNALVDAKFARGVRGRASINDHTRAREWSSLDSNLVRNWNGSAGLTLGDRLTVEYLENGRDDPKFSSSPRRREQFMKAGIKGELVGVLVSGSASLGRALDRPDGDNRLERYSAAAAFSPDRRTSISVSAEAMRGGSLFLPSQRSLIGGGLSASFDARPGSRFAISGYVSERRLATPVRDASLEVSWDQALPRGHHVSLRARLHRNPLFVSPDNNVLRAEYTMPFGLPVGHSRSRGRVSGRVFELESGAGVSGAVVQLGTQVTVTDDRGRFAFSTEGEAPVMLSIGGSAATAGLIPVRELPLSIVPRTGRTSTFDIGLTRSGRIEGKVRRFFLPPATKPGDTPDAVEDVLGLAGATVELRQDGDVRRTISNGRGEFVFTDLRPGRWSLTITSKDLPPYSYVEGDSVAVFVRPGDSLKSEITVRPRTRKLRIVQGG